MTQSWDLKVENLSFWQTLIPFLESVWVVRWDSMFFTQGVWRFDDERSSMSLQSFNILRPLFSRSKVSSSACNAWGPKHGIAREGITSLELSEVSKWLSARSNSQNQSEMEYWTLHHHVMWRWPLEWNWCIQAIYGSLVPQAWCWCAPEPLASLRWILSRLEGAWRWKDTVGDVNSREVV